jgi:hypothetical protein
VTAAGASTQVTACDEAKSNPPAASASASSAPTVRPLSSAAASASSAPATAPTPPDDTPRVYAKTRHVWVRPTPSLQGWIGYLWFGASVKLRDTRPRYGPGCTQFYAIEPRGFVCLDGNQATLDPNDPVFAQLREHAPALDTPWPHRYGESRGAQRYRTLPTREQQRRREWDLAVHEQRVARARQGEVHASLRGVDLTPATATPFTLQGIPSTVHENRSRLRPLSTVAYSTEVLFEKRSWLLSADLMWVPKDRVAPYPKVDFRGVELGRDADLPLAFFRDADRPKYTKEDSGQLVRIDETFARLSWVELTGTQLEQDGKTYLETRASNVWVDRADAVVPEPQSRTPWGAPVGGEDTTGKTPMGRATWLEASVWKGWLLAYEGTRPVYATMISPGRGGTPARGKDPLETASTPTGTFKITGKFATATMEAPGEFIHSDVPWAQNFHGPHALHGAYWHNDWGHRKSGGCVNVSPRDGRYLFFFTEPQIPDGWHGVRWRPSAEPATTFVVHD